MNPKQEEVSKLREFICENFTYSSADYFLISKVGSGFANKYGIWDLIEPKLEELKESNPSCIILLYKEELPKELTNAGVA